MADESTQSWTVHCSCGHIEHGLTEADAVAVAGRHNTEGHSPSINAETGARPEENPEGPADA